VAPSPCPSSPGLKTISRVVAVGRNANLVGTALSASTGTINQEQIATRPLLRPGEVLEDIPGLIISQHSGGGKANQYYLRGFQLDHGTDLEAELNGVPVNLGTHAHGQGYSDINYLMPELVGYVEFKKGTYFADQGDFAVAGGYQLYYRNTIKPTTDFTLGDFGYDRFFTADSASLGAGNLLYAVEIAHDNGSYVMADEYHRYNEVLRYSMSRGASDFAITGIAYNGAFGSTDQIPQRTVNQGLISRFGYEDPTDGGNTYRYALSSQFTHADPNGDTKFNAYGVVSLLNLFSNFTYYQFDANDYYNVTQNPIRVIRPTSPARRTPERRPLRGRTSISRSARPTIPRRSVLRHIPSHSRPIRLRAATSANRSTSGSTMGSTRVGVSSHRARSRRSVPASGTILSPSSVSISRTRNNSMRTARSVTIMRPIRANSPTSNRVFGSTRSSNSRPDYVSITTTIPSRRSIRRTRVRRMRLLDPKFALAYAASPHEEFNADYGTSFHSNDARGVIGNNDPQTHASFDSTGAPVQFNSPLTRAVGYELGYRYSSPKITTTLSAFRLFVANELIFDGDHGTTSVGGPDVRQGSRSRTFSRRRRI
jgi:hypothetical protein